MSDTIEKYRNEIDEIDMQLAGLLNDRIRLCLLIGEEKKKLGINVKDADRESRIMDRLKNAYPEVSELTENIYAAIFKYSRGLQGISHE